MKTLTKLKEVSTKLKTMLNKIVKALEEQAKNGVSENRGFRIIFILLSLSFASCKTSYVTNYKVEAPDRNYYTNHIEHANDSVYFFEENRNGLIRCKAKFPENLVTIKSK